MTESGVRYDPGALDAVERRFWRDVWTGMPEGAAERHGVELRDFGPLQVTTVRELPEAPMLNLVLGATATAAADSGELERALAWAESQEVSFYVPVKESARGGAATERLLEARGYERGYAWMKFVRDAHAPRFSAPSDVEVAPVEGDEEPFGMIAATGFGLPAWAADFFAGLHAQAGWHCYVARVDEESAACAAMLVHDGIAEFGIAATLEPARGRGCQLALLHRRIVDAAAAGCRTLFVETGERLANRPSASYRNILRAGFEEAYLRPNWSPATAPPRRP
jgi:hypothetical protein